MDNKKKVISLLLFLGVFALTLYTFFYGQNIAELMSAIKKMNIFYTVIAVLLGQLFVCMEGIMIWYMLHSMGEKSSVLECIKYSFIGFFYSGITPSATGGQPMQLYYMKKAGRSTSKSTVTLMTVAVMYKFVLVLIGIALLLVWKAGLVYYLGDYFYLYLIGLLLNAVLVLFILAVMFYATVMQKTGMFLIHKLAAIGVIRKKENAIEKWNCFVAGYTDAVIFVKNQKKMIVVLLLLTLIQRCTVFFVTYMVYLGFAQSEKSAIVVTTLQASVYIAVDMLPVPGAQGITEMMYKSVFAQIFTSGLLIPSMLASRVMNFYFPLIVSLIVALVQKILLMPSLKKNN